MKRNNSALTPAERPAPPLHFWHPATTSCLPIRKALSTRYRLEKAETPLEACAAHRSLLLYETPEQALYSALEDSAADMGAVIADWCQQAQQLLEASQASGDSCTLADLSACYADPAAFAAHFDVRPPQRVTAPRDPLRMLLARNLLSGAPDMQALATDLARQALPLSAPSSVDAPDDTSEQNLPMAAAQAYLDLRATGSNSASLHPQIALLMDQKNLMQQELETLERITQESPQAASDRLAGKEKAIQALGQRLRECQSQNIELQNALTRSRDTGRQTSEGETSKFHKAIRSMRLRAPS